MRLLFIEDEKKDVEDIMQTLEDNNNQCNVCGFAEAQEQISRFDPDIIVLDLTEKGLDNVLTVPGKDRLDYIWEQKFSPVVIFTALGKEALEDQAITEEHPYILHIQKGAGAEILLLKGIENFKPHVDAIRETASEIHVMFTKAIRDSAPYGMTQGANADEQIDIVRRMSRRRLAAQMDLNQSSEENLAPLEQYIHPPLTESLLTGDLIRLIDSPIDVPSSFLVVLSPSCDLANGETRTPKVSHILAARCTTWDEGKSLLGKSTQGMKKFLDSKRDLVLTQGFCGQVLAFPKLPGVIPDMIADLKELELIPINDIYTENSSYLVVASVDSPFRETIAWAFMQTACRPGLPDRDIDSWEKDIIQASIQPT